MVSTGAMRLLQCSFRQWVSLRVDLPARIWRGSHFLKSANVNFGLLRLAPRLADIVNVDLIGAFSIGYMAWNLSLITFAAANIIGSDER